MTQLDWGHVTPEAAILNENKFVYIYNHDLSSVEKIDRTVRFILGRLSYYDTHLPSNPIHQIKLDLRGQRIKKEICDSIQQEIKNKYARPDSLEIEFVK